MPTGEIHGQTDGSPSKGMTPTQALRSRRIAIATAVVFCISAVFPAAAGLSKYTDSFPVWWGPLDVGLAFVLALLALLVVRITQGQIAREADEISYRAYRILIHGILAMTVVFMLSGNRIVWINCITGFAWRTWLLLYCLPAWLTAFNGIQSHGRGR